MYTYRPLVEGRETDCLAARVSPWWRGPPSGSEENGQTQQVVCASVSDLRKITDCDWTKLITG